MANLTIREAFNGKCDYLVVDNQIIKQIKVIDEAVQNSSIGAWDAIHYLAEYLEYSGQLTLLREDQVRDYGLEQYKGILYIVEEMRIKRLNVKIKKVDMLIEIATARHEITIIEVEDLE